MKKLLLSLAAVAFIFSACGPKTQSIHLGDFTATIPASFEILHQEDSYPESAALYFQSEDGALLALNNIVYYSDEEIEHVEDLYDGIEGFLENKIIELFNNVDEGPLHEQLFSAFTIEDIDEIKFDEDGVGRFAFSGVFGEEDQPFVGDIIIYFHGGALVKQLALADTDEQIEELNKIALDLKFDE